MTVKLKSPLYSSQALVRRCDIGAGVPTCAIVGLIGLGGSSMSGVASDADGDRSSEDPQRSEVFVLAALPLTGTTIMTNNAV